MKKKKIKTIYHQPTIGKKKTFIPPKKILFLSDWKIRFQNGYNIVVMDLSEVQFLSKIIVISNHTFSAHSFDLEMTHMI